MFMCLQTVLLKVSHRMQRAKQSSESDTIIAIAHVSCLSMGSLASDQLQQLHLIGHLQHTGCQSFDHGMACAGDVNKRGHCHCCTKLSPV